MEQKCELLQIYSIEDCCENPGGACAPPLCPWAPLWAVVENGVRFVRDGAFVYLCGLNM